METAHNITNQPPTKQNEETNEQELPNVAKVEKRVKEVKPATKKEIEQLNDRVKNQLSRNRRTYQKLISINPYFSIKLYCPLNNFKPQDYNTASIQTMMRQLQLLLDDGRVLEKQIMKAELKKMQSQHRQAHGSEWRHHYAYLRKIWLNANECESDRPIDMMDQLNKKVVLIKNNLFSTIQLQKQSYGKTSNDQYEHVQRKIGEITQNVQDYQQLKQKYQNMKMAFEDISQKLSNKVEEMKMKVGQRNDVIRQIKSDNQQLRRVNKQLKEKLLLSERREVEMLKSVSGSSIQFKVKDKDIDMKSPSRNLIKSNSELLNFQTIKFQKIQSQELILSAQQLQSPQTIKNEEVEPKQNKNMLNSPQLQRQLSENVNNNNSQLATDRRYDLSDTKSIDGKRNRFVRMRSPGGGKLMKNKNDEVGQKKMQEIGSPGFKERRERKGQE